MVIRKMLNKGRKAMHEIFNNDIQNIKIIINKTHNSWD